MIIDTIKFFWLVRPMDGLISWIIDLINKL